jgi:hypothetical protein
MQPSSACLQIWRRSCSILSSTILVMSSRWSFTGWPLKRKVEKEEERALE